MATSEPFCPGLSDALRLASGLRVRFALSPAADIEKAAKKFYGVGADTLDRLIAGNEIDLDTAVQRIEENLGLYFSEQQ